MGPVIRTRIEIDDLAGAFPGRSAVSPLVSLGDATEVVVRHGETLVWRSMAFGMTEREDDANRVAFAREDRLESVLRWSMLVRARCVVPVHGVDWWGDGKFNAVRGWALGFWERDGVEQFVLVKRVVEGRSTLVASDWPTASAWLRAKQWEVLPQLAAAGVVVEGATPQTA